MTGDKQIFFIVCKYFMKRTPGVVAIEKFKALTYLSVMMFSAMRDLCCQSTFLNFYSA